MAAFRRCVLALAVLAIFAGLASAQQPQPMTCSLSSLNTAARAEGKSELMSDLLITCAGGTPQNLASQTTLQAPTANLTLTLPSAITSRILTSSSGASDAVLLIDDPNTNTSTPLATGYGAGAAPVVCATPTTGCAAFPNTSNTPNPNIQVMSATGGAPGAPTTGAANIYQGIIQSGSPNSVTFFGVPVIPPGSTSTRTFRITNVRTNASGGPTGAIVGTLSVPGGTGNGQQLISLSQTSITLATVQASLTTKATAATGLTNCGPTTLQFAGTVSFTELFGSAFKTRTTAGGTQYSGQSSGAVQGIGIGFSESGYETTIGSGSTAVVTGLADFGTRLKAVFNNIPAGVRVFVSFGNMEGTNVSAGTLGSINATFFTSNALTSAVGSNVSISGKPVPFAALINGAENLSDGSGTPPLVSSFTTPAAGATLAGIPYVEITPPTGITTATAVWEVLNTNTAAVDNYTFDVFISYPAQQATGTMTTNLSYAPTLTTNTLPSFADTSTVANFVSIGQCKTTLLFPYVTSAAGFDTGIAIANTTADPFGTVAQTGPCSVTLYGGPSPIPTVPAAVWNVPGVTAPQSSIPSGTVGVFSLNGAGISGFSGYAIAVCSFQFAHGFAFVADWTSVIQSSAMGYLGLVMPYTGTAAGSRSTTTGETLTQ